MALTPTRQLILMLLSLALLTAPLSPALAWGVHGHRLIATLAEQELAPDTRMRIEALLEGESLSDAAVWADQMRAAGDHPFWSYDYSANWHFINIEAGHSYADSDKSPRGDAYTALTAFSAILRGEPLARDSVREGLERYLDDGLDSPQAQKLALKFAIHLIADLHQPMHLGYPDDRGGNDITLQWQGRRTNLHALWDTPLANPEQLGLDEHRRRLLALPRDAAFRELADQTDPLRWIEEGLVIREQAYADLENYAPEDYVSRFSALAAQRMLLAALRLSAWLELTLGPQ